MSKHAKLTALAKVISEDMIYATVLRELVACSTVYGGAQVVQEELSPSKIIPLAKTVVRDRLERWLIYLKQFPTHLRPYEPFLLEEDAACRLILPPVVEHWRDERKYYLIDGTHRIKAFQLINGEKPLILTVVNANIHQPLPCSPSTWAQLKLCVEQPGDQDIFANFNPQFFRPLTPHYNSSRFIFPTREEALLFCHQSGEPNVH